MPTYYGTNTSGMNNAANNVLDIQQAHQYNQRYQDEKRARSRAMAIQSLQGLGDKLYQYGRDQKADTVSKEIRDANKLYQDEQLKLEKARDARETAKSIYDRYDSWKKDKTAQANAEREMKRLEDALSATKEHYRAIEQGTTNRNNLDAAKFNEELRAAKYKPVMELISGVGDAFKDGLAASRAAAKNKQDFYEKQLSDALNAMGTKTITDELGTKTIQSQLSPEQWQMLQTNPLAQELFKNQGGGIQQPQAAAPAATQDAIPQMSFEDAMAYLQEYKAIGAPTPSTPQQAAILEAALNAADQMKKLKSDRHWLLNMPVTAGEMAPPNYDGALNKNQEEMDNLLGKPTVKDWQSRITEMAKADELRRRAMGR